MCESLVFTAKMVPSWSTAMDRRFCVVYTRPAPGGVVVRRRACRQCGTRISTREREIGA
jgi:hypothetical protein